jgi:nucleoside-diphosphate-sugar epimerase
MAESNVKEPLNLGSDELVTINQLVEVVEHIAGIQLRRKYNLQAPRGVRGRNSDNTRIRQALGWAPSISLYEGMCRTYHWIEREMAQAAPVHAPATLREHYVRA